MGPILQKTLPYEASHTNALPAIKPLDPQDWLLIDEAYAGQMRERERLIADHRDSVIMLDAQALEAAEELLEQALLFMQSLPGFEVENETVICPDHRRVTVLAHDPLATLGRLFQNDFCILQKIDDEHVLTGAVLCFPASWTLAEKFIRPLSVIHDLVPDYDANIEKRVQRLFDGVKADRPLWRFNALHYAKPDLYQPRRHDDPRTPLKRGTARYFRSERQTLVRLPTTNAVIFGIHTFVLEA